MNKAHVQLWVDALRSGEYKQCEGRLYNPIADAYCCLGVAIRVYEKATGEVMEETLEYGGTLTDSSIREWYDLDQDPRFASVYVTVYNDKLGKTFPEIADLIEQEMNKE